MKYQGSEYQKKKEEKKMSIGFEIFQRLTQAGLYIVSFFGYFFYVWREAPVLTERATKRSKWKTGRKEGIVLLD